MVIQFIMIILKGKKMEKVKYLLLFIFLFLNLYSCSCVNSINKEVSIKYRKIIKYLTKSDSLKWYESRFGQIKNSNDLFVADSTVFLPYEPFDEEILFSRVEKPKMYSEYPRQLDNFLIDSLKNVDSLRIKRHDKEEGLSCLSTLKSSHFSLFFSKPYRNTVVIKILHDPDTKRNFTEVISNNLLSLDFLFVFDSNEQIISVFCRTIGYN